MSEETHISDELLTAFLDGEVSDADRLRIEQALKEDTQLAARLAALEIPISVIRDGFDAALASAPRMPEMPSQKAALGSMVPAGIAAGILVIGFALGSFLNRPAQQGWVEAVANYQSLYVTGTLARSEPLDTRAERLASLSREVGVDLAPLLDLQGVDYRRAQLLGFEGKPLVQVAYLDGDVPIAICITHVRQEDRAITEDVLFGMAAASWQRDGIGYLVIGGSDKDLVRRLARSVEQAI